MRLGATTRPLDGRALTHGVDARAGEGAGSSAATLHGAAVSRLVLAKAFFRGFKGEASRGQRDRKGELVAV
jgi:hypothetical protein